MRRYTLLAGLMSISLLTGCMTQPTDAEWPSFTTALSGFTVSISAPRGHFKDVNVSNVDLAADQKLLLPLFERAWVASGLVGDKGGLELKLLLAKHYAKSAQHEFMAAVRLDIERELARARMSAELINPTKRTIGNREWNCFVIKALQIPNCVLQLSADYYLIWRRSWIANSSQNPPSDFIELADRVERSINVAF